MTTRIDGKIMFSFFRPDAQRVSVVGDFNGWNPQRHPMTREASGLWTCTLELPPGSHQFRYLVDSEWVVDCASFGLQPGPFGWNSVVYVEPALAA
jgi:1,4-alpha-glucan branching enzyme